jgi:hypothetical protein
MADLGPDPTTPSEDARSLPSSTSESNVVPASGKRQAFRDVRRQLQDTELGSPGVQKLLLDDLDRAEGECENLRGYVDRFYSADKRAAIFEERARGQTAFEILFTVGIGVGSAVLGLAPYFWDATARGPLTLFVGFSLILGATAARIVKK